MAGSILLNNRFPQPPGAFKRLGALIAVGQIWPFFELEPRPSGRLSLWTARILALFIPPALGMLEVDISDYQHAPHWVKLRNWRGFASQHVGVEFLELLSWYDNRGWPSNVNLQEKDETRLAQLALSVALILETSYYCGELATSLQPAVCIRGRGPCLRALRQDLTSLSFLTAIPDKRRT